MGFLGNWKSFVYKPSSKILSRANKIGNKTTMYPLNKTAAGRFVTPSRVKAGITNSGLTRRR